MGSQEVPEGASGSPLGTPGGLEELRIIEKQIVLMHFHTGGGLRTTLEAPLHVVFRLFSIADRIHNRFC